jgi:fructose-bisphosphate aldolase, class I
VLAPIVEPEVLMDGAPSIERCAEVTAEVHAVVREELGLLNVDMAGIVLGPLPLPDWSARPGRIAGRPG